MFSSQSKSLSLVGVVIWFSFALSSPCAKIATKFETWKSEGGHGDFDGIGGGLAYECLNSIPIDQNLALAFLEQYKVYLQFQSTIVTLKHAPTSYISPTVDLWDGLERIRNKLISGAFSSQYDFDNSLHRLISQANDGHLQIGLCSREIFRFQHGVPLTSISRDGIELPQLYIYSDAVLIHEGRVDHISPVVEINGLSADYYLQSRIAVTVGYQDPDARYNSLFPSPAAGFTGTYSGGTWASKSGEWPGSAILTIRLANGTKLEIKPTATWPAVNGPMDYTNGQALFEAACVPDSSSKHVFGSFPGIYLGPSAYELPASGPSAYPAPDIEDSSGLVRLYSLENAPQKDVAILQVASFRVRDKGSREFSATIRKSLEYATSRGKTKLLLDLSSNDGGDVIPGFDLFRMLFPDQPIRSATRFRSTELVDVLGQAFSEAYHDADAKAAMDPPLSFKDAVGPDQGNIFTSWKDLFGPDSSTQSDTMSNAYAVFNLDAASTTDNPISGYGSVPLDPSTRPFNPQDVVLVTDGRCGSTCAILVGLLQAQGVRTLAFGGRPRNAPMQAVGGVKGGQRWSLRTISRHIRTAKELLANEYASAALNNNTSRRLAFGRLIQRLNDLAPPSLPAVPRREDDYLEWEFALRFDTYGQSSINFRDAYVPINETTPWQFIYEAADCRLFLTLENVMEPASRWVSAAQAMFGEEGISPRACVGHRSGRQ